MILEVKYLLFADDLKIDLPVTNIDVCCKLQNDINTLNNLSENHCTVLNIDKCNCKIYFKSKYYPSCPELLELLAFKVPTKVTRNSESGAHRYVESVIFKYFLLVC